MHSSGKSQNLMTWTLITWFISVHKIQVGLPRKKNRLRKYYYIDSENKCVPICSHHLEQTE